MNNISRKQRGRSRRDRRRVIFTLGVTPMDSMINLFGIIVAICLCVSITIGMNKSPKIAYAETAVEEVASTDDIVQIDVQDEEETEEFVSPVIAAGTNSTIAETVQETEPFEPVTKYVSARAGLNVRTAPDTNAEVVDTIGYNNEVLVIGESDGWYQVESGYVSSEFLSDEKSPSLPYTDEDLYIMAHVLAGECQSYSDQEQRYVASVVMNRKNSKRFPNTIKGVVFQKGQYACTWDGNYYRNPTERNWANARYILENGSILPENVVYQSGFPQGKIYTKTDVHYYCYE